MISLKFVVAWNQTVLTRDYLGGVTLAERPRAKGPPMRIRLAAVLTAAIVLLPVATASANPSSSPQPAKKCPEAMNFILDHCD